MEEDIKRDIVNYRRQKACDLMHDVDVLIDNELWNSAVNRMYYACFHMVSALLILHGIEVKSRHSCISPWQYNHVIQRLWTL